MQMQAQIVGYLRSVWFNSRRLSYIVNYIRLNPESFSEWHKANTAKLFAPLIFRNEKKASGYLFELYVIKHISKILSVSIEFVILHVIGVSPIQRTETKRRYVFCLSERSVGNLFHNRQEKVIIVSTS